MQTLCDGVLHFGNVVGRTLNLIPETQNPCEPVDDSLSTCPQDRSGEDDDTSPNDVRFIENRRVSLRSTSGRGGSTSGGRQGQLRSRVVSGGQNAHVEAGEESSLEERVKRVRTEQSGEERGVKRQKTTDAQRSQADQNAARLFGTKPVPSNLQSTVVHRGQSSFSPEPEFVRSKPTMPYKTFASSRFVVRNTLGETRFSQQDSLNRGYSGSPRTSGSNIRHSGARVVGSGSAALYADGGDGFSRDERKTKRRKMEQNVSGRSEDMDIFEGEIIEHNGRRVFTDSALEKSILSPTRPLPFTTTEFNKVDRILAPGRTKPKIRRRSGGNRLANSNSSQGSRQDLSSVNDLHADTYDTERPGNSIDDMVVEEARVRHRMRTDRESLEALKVPVEDLGRNLNQSKKPNKSAGPAHASSTQQNSSRRRQASVERIEQRQRRDAVRGPQDTMQRAPNRSQHSSPAAPPQESLAKTFIRDKGPAPLNSQIRAMQNVRSDRKRTGDRVSSISEDELAGDATNLKRGASQDHSPAKQARHTDRLRKSSPSDIRPTMFTQKKKKTVLQDPYPPTQDERTRVKIASFFSKGCVLTLENDLWLSWDEREGTIDLHHDGQPQVYEGQQKTVGLERKHLAKISYCKGLDKIHINGSMDPLSNGHTCIQFIDVDDVVWFQDVARAINDDVTLQHQTPERMESMYKMQSDELRKSYQIYQRRGTSSITTSVRQQGEEIVESEDDDQILYEDAEGTPLTTGSARQRMERVSQPEGRTSTMARSDLQAGDRHESKMSPFFAEATRRSLRRTQPAEKPPRSRSPERWTQIHKPKRWTQPVLYPPQGGPNVATVEFRDLKTLDETEFINDNIIAFALRQIQDKMKPEQREQVYFFNSFFYPTLTSKNGKQSACNFQAVSRWTRKADLLSKSFIVVPINLDLHWFVAIICNVDQLPRKRANIEDDSNTVEATQSSPAIEETIPRSPSPKDSSLESLTAKRGDDDSRPLVSKDSHDDGNIRGTHPLMSRKSKKKSAPPLRKYDTSQPIVITLDSLGGNHPAELRNLKDYIVAEALDKRDISIHRDLILGMNVKDLPEQTNFCDCGLYLVGYIEEFAKDPRKFVDRILSRRSMDRESEFAKFNPSQKRAEIRHELLRLNADQESAREAKKKQKAEEKKASVSPEKPASKADALRDMMTKEHVKVDNQQSAESRIEQHVTPDEAQRKAVAPTKLVEEPSIVEIETQSPVDQQSASTDDAELETEVPRALKPDLPFYDFSPEPPPSASRDRLPDVQLHRLTEVDETEGDSDSADSSIQVTPHSGFVKPAHSCC